MKSVAEDGPDGEAALGIALRVGEDSDHGEGERRHAPYGNPLRSHALFFPSELVGERDGVLYDKGPKVGREVPLDGDRSRISRSIKDDGFG